MQVVEQGVKIVAEVRKGRGPAPAGTDHDVRPDGEILYRLVSRFPSEAPVWIGRGNHIDLGTVPSGIDETCPRHCIELRFHVDHMDIRLGSSRIGTPTIHADYIHPRHAQRLLPWTGPVEEVTQKPRDPEFAAHPKVRVLSRFLDIEILHLDCRIRTMWEPTSESVVQEDLTLPTSPTPLRITYADFRPSPVVQDGRPQTATAHFMIAMDAIDRNDLEGRLGLVDRARILNRLASLKELTPRKGDLPFDPYKVRVKQEAIVREVWRPASCATFAEYVSLVGLPGTIDGLSEAASRLTQQYLSSPWA